MIAADLDGTLLDYAPEGPTPRANVAILRRLAYSGVQQLAILTNQGGLPFGVMGILRRDGRPYPSPGDFARRLNFARAALGEYGIAAVAVRVSCYHPKAPDAAIQAAARQVRGYVDVMSGVDWRVYTTDAARKPQPLMLRNVRATIYYGDSDEDEQAATAAGCHFVRVARFL